VRAGALFACFTAGVTAVPRAKCGDVKETGVRSPSGASGQLAAATDGRENAVADEPSGSFREFALHRRVHGHLFPYLTFATRKRVAHINKADA